MASGKMVGSVLFLASKKMVCGFLSWSWFLGKWLAQHQHPPAYLHVFPVPPHLNSCRTLVVVLVVMSINRAWVYATKGINYGRAVCYMPRGCFGARLGTRVDPSLGITRLGISLFEKSVPKFANELSGLDEATGSPLRFPGVARLILRSRRPLLKLRNRFHPARSIGPSSSSHPDDGGFWPQSWLFGLLARIRRRPDAMTTMDRANAPDATGYAASKAVV